MPTKIRIELDQAGIQAFMNGPEIQADLISRCSAVAAAAGDGMDWAVTNTDRDKRGQTRWRGEVWTATEQARLAEAEDRVLLRALMGAADAGGGGRGASSRGSTGAGHASTAKSATGGGTTRIPYTNSRGVTTMHTPAEIASYRHF